jgi:hypothetical protein
LLSKFNQICYIIMTWHFVIFIVHNDSVRKDNRPKSIMVMNA